MITLKLARDLIVAQFPAYAHLPLTSVKQQGHDHGTYRLGDALLMRLPVESCYALKVPLEQALLPKLAPHLSVQIPAPVNRGEPSDIYPHAFSIYQWREGDSLNFLTLSASEMDQLAVDLARFLKELQAIKDVEGPAPGPHNWWRGESVRVYDQDARAQIKRLDGLVHTEKALHLWDQACATSWTQPPLWLHGDMAVGNILLQKGKLSAVIDFGGMAVGDPACDLVMAWTYFSGPSRHIFMQEMNLDKDTWLRSQAWALWKSTFELCQMKDHESPFGQVHKRILQELGLLMSRSR